MVSRSRSGASRSEVYFDRQGNAVRLRRSELARQFGSKIAGFDPVRQLGYTRVRSTGRGLFVEFDPAAATPTGVAVAFHEIAHNAPDRIVLVRGRPSWFEVFSMLRRAFEEIEALAAARSTPDPIPPTGKP